MSNHERDYWARQVATLERQRGEAVRQAEAARVAIHQCDGALMVCRHRLDLLGREAMEAAEAEVTAMGEAVSACEERAAGGLNGEA